MTLLAFLLGLVLGIGFWLWQHRRLQQQLGKMLGSLRTDVSSSSLSAISRLRREIALANQHREELQEELQVKQQLLLIAPLGYLQVDEEHRLLWCNEQARQLLQIDRWEPGQLRLLLELVRSYELDRLIEKTREQQQPNIREWEFHPPCLDGAAMGKVRSLKLRASSWPLPQRQVGIFLENRQPLVDLTESRNQWVSDLAHELRTPLTSIRLVAEAFQGQLEPPKSRWAERMLQETNRLINLVQDWLDVSNLEKHPSESLTCQPVELQALIHAAWHTLEPLAQLQQLTLAYSGPDTLWIRADEARLSQVFLNLFDNSIKHSPFFGTIWVKVARLDMQNSDSEATEDALPDSTVADYRSELRDHDTLTLDEKASGQYDSALASFSPHDSTPRRMGSDRHCIQIDIIDSGTGFSDIDLPHVFERLYRGDNSRQRQLTDDQASQPLGRSSGNGLGLSIVQQIIHAHNGLIEAKNHPETGGAWLQIKLPYSKI